MHLYQIPVWKEAPFIRLVLPLIIGICSQQHFPVSIIYFSILAFIHFLFILLEIFLPIFCKFKYRFILSANVFLFIFNFGLFLKWNNLSVNNNHWFGHYLSDSSYLLLRINDQPVIKSNFIKSNADVISVVKNKTVLPCNGKIITYFRNKETALDLKYGDVLLIRCKPSEIRNSGNPGFFDFKQYQSNQQIYHHVYLNQNDYDKINFNNQNALYTFIFSLKNRTLSILKKYIPNTAEFGIAEALLIGYKNDLDNEIVEAYSKTGVVHIIAISGLHLGLIYLLLIWIFDRIPFLKKSKMLKYSIVILALWIFSLLTGSSSSVLRSAVMFSCIAFGKVFNRKSSVYNSLAASAFILLCYNPNLIWDVGFQLSYLAILGIVVLQKPIQHFVSSNGIIKRKLWEMISITLAAQIFTFPICLYYFHQFPTLFLLSNIISVPLSTVILFMEILLIAISPLPALAKVIGFVAEQSIKFLNGFISFLSDLSFSTLDNIYADKSTTAILYIILILLVAFYFKKNKELLKWSLISVTLFFCCIANAFIKIEKQKKIIFYNYSHKKAIDFIEGSDFCFEGSFDKIEQDKLRKNILNSSRKYFGANTESNHLKGLYKKENVFLFHDKVIVMIDSAVKYKTLLNPISIDILYISNNPGIELKELIKSMNPKIVLFAGSNKNYRINKWKIECETLGLKYHSIKENGAFICTIE